MDGTALSSPTPFTPPTTEEDRLSWLRLIRSHRVGATTFLRLMSEHSNAAAALDALPSIAAQAGIDTYTPCPRDVALREMDLGYRKGAYLLFLGDADYPATLAALADPPPLLWARGRQPVLAMPAVALVGSRNASSLGARMARKLAEGLGWHGLCVVSGLARGIDTAAHGGALKSGTIAVMAGGVDVTYPPENDTLAAAIADQGLLVSEQPMGLQPQARHFPRRNRLIAGLSVGVVVVEAAEGSGSLITARDALDQGREVLAVPGHPMDTRAAGCNALIRDGARLVRDVADILDALGPALPDRALTGQPRPASPASTSPEAAPRRTAQQASAHPSSRAAGPSGRIDTLTLHRLILDRLSTSPVAEDQLSRDLDLPSATLAPALLFLELDGRVRRQPGGLLSRG